MSIKTKYLVRNSCIIMFLVVLCTIIFIFKTLFFGLLAAVLLVAYANMILELDAQCPGA